MTPLELFGFPVFSTVNPDISASDSGFIAAVKPIGKSSFWVVKRFRHEFQLKKIGHCGTLDPAASGLMILAFGKATRSIEQLQLLPKTYRAEVTFGATTASLDGDTPIERTLPVDHIQTELIQKTLETFFSGTILQVPPMFSALKKDGVRLYDLARKGVEVERKPREATIYSSEIHAYNPPVLDITVVCSKGTYIRTLAADLGEKLNSCAYLSGLIRTQIGEIRLTEALETPIYHPS